MSILIRGITIEQFYKDLNTVDDTDVGWDIRQLPPHGRLIDADALREDWLENGENEYVYDTNDFLESIDSVPTIIDAEEGE